MGNYDFVNYGVLRNCYWKGLLTPLVEVDWQTFPDIPFRAFCGFDLFVYNLFFPSGPRDTYVFHCILKDSTFTIKKYEDVIVKHSDEVTKFVPVLFAQIRPTPQLQKCSLTEGGEPLFCGCDTYRFFYFHERNTHLSA